MNDETRVEILKKLEIINLLSQMDYETIKDYQIALSGIEILIKDIIENINNS